MGPGRIALHAAQGLKEDEFRYLHWRLGEHGVQCPHPLDLPRGCIIGSVEVTGVISESDSEWFGGQAGLTLKNPVPCAPIPCAGALGYFEWARGGKLAPPTKWMTNWGTPGAGAASDLFPEAPIAFERPPKKPWG
jgi:hypothetical protein